MPQNITDVNTWSAVVTAPAAGDAVASAAMLASLQALANRTFWIKSLIGAASGLAQLDGTTKVPVAQLPVNLASGVCGLNGSAQVAAGQLPYSIANGVARLDGSARLPAGTVRNGIPQFFGVTSSGTSGGTIASTSSSTFVDVPGMSFVLPANVGDVAILLASVPVDTTPSTGAMEASLAVIDNSVTIDLQKQLLNNRAQPAFMSFATVYTVSTTGSLTCKMRYRALANTAYVYHQASIVALLLRP